jgi:hypothetical protein
MQLYFVSVDTNFYVFEIHEVFYKVITSEIKLIAF